MYGGQGVVICPINDEMDDMSFRNCCPHFISLILKDENGEMIKDWKGHYTKATYPPVRKIEVEYEFENVSSVITTDGDNKTGRLPIVKRKFKGFTKKIPDPAVNKHGKPIVFIVSMEVAMHIQRPDIMFPGELHYEFGRLGGTKSLVSSMSFAKDEDNNKSNK